MKLLCSSWYFFGCDDFIGAYFRCREHKTIKERSDGSSETASRLHPASAEMVMCSLSAFVSFRVHRPTHQCGSLL